jgi:hypothetical protein
VSGNIFVEVGLANLPEDQKLQLLEQMNDLIHKRAMLKVLETLTDEQKEELLGTQNSSEDEQMQKLTRLMPNLSAVILEEVEQVKNEIRASVISPE